MGSAVHDLPFHHPEDLDVKYAPPAVIALLESGEPFAVQDCYKYTLTNGQVYRFTNGQADVRYQPNNEGSPFLYSADGILVNGILMHSQRGVVVDEQELDVSARDDVLINGQGFIKAARLGFFDGAIVQRDRVYFTNWSIAPIGSVTLFIGRVSTIDPGGGTKIAMKVKSELVLLNQKMPRNFFQTSCKNTLFDGGCTLVKSDFAVLGTVGAGSTRQIINWASATADIYSLGTVTFETGADVGVSRTVKISNGTQLILRYPLDYLPATGDQFKAYPGCDLTLATCGGALFNNAPNFRGFPFIPPSQTSI